MWFRSRAIREGQPSTWLPPEPRPQAAEHGLVRVVVDLGSQPDLAVLVELVAWKAARPRLVSCQLGRTRGAVWLSVKRSWRDGPCHQCHRGCTGGAPQDRREGRDGQIRTHLVTSAGVMHPSWEWLWLRVWVTEKRFAKMNVRGANRNATTPETPFPSIAVGLLVL